MPQVTTVTDPTQVGVFYDSIPFNLLFTDLSTPQVTVESNGILSSCPDYNCQYEFLSDQASNPVMISATFNKIQKTLTMKFQNADAFTQD